jgi:hypothetical protein
MFKTHCALVLSPWRGRGVLQMRLSFSVLPALAATVLTLVSNATLAMTAQEFLAAENRGEFSSAQQKRQTQRAQPVQQRARVSVPSQTQQASLSQTSALAGLSLSGSWLASNMGAARPAGAPGPWCGYAMRLEMVAQGHGDPGPEFNGVSHWCRVGSAAPVGAIGSIFVSRGHVSKVVAGDCPAGTVATISGNATGARVSQMCEPIARAVCSRWPGKVNS